MQLPGLNTANAPCVPKLACPGSSEKRTRKPKLEYASTDPWVRFLPGNFRGDIATELSDVVLEALHRAFLRPPW